MADTLAAAPGVGGEAAEDEDQDMVYEDAHSLHLVEVPRVADTH